MRKISSRDSYGLRKVAYAVTEFVNGFNMILRGGPRTATLIEAMRAGIVSNPGNAAAALRSFGPAQIANLGRMIPGLSSVVAAESTALAAGAGTALSGAAAGTGAASGAAGAAGAGSVVSGVTGAGAAGSAAAGGAGTTALVGGASGAGSAAAGTAGSTALVASSGGAGGASTAAGTAGTAAAGIGAGAVSIAAAAAALLAYPKIGQLLYGGIDEEGLKTNPSDTLKVALINTVRSYWEPIIACDVAEGDYGGDLADIAKYENTRIIKNYADILHASTTNIRMREYALKEITLDNIARQLAEAEDQSGGTWAARFIVGAREDRSYDMIMKSPCVVKGASDFTGWVAQYIAAIKSRDPILAAKGGGTGGGTQTGGGGGGGGQTGGGGGGRGGGRPSGGTGLDYPGASKVMMEKGFIDSIETDWTPKFDDSFRRFIDAATRGTTNITDTDLVFGQTWGEVADDIGFPPDARGGIMAVKALAKYIGGSGETGTKPTTEVKPTEPGKSETPAVSGKLNILAQMIGILYSERLVEGGGFLSYEKKQTQSLVDSKVVGGPNPSGFRNAAEILLKRNPQLDAVLPSELAMPVSKKSIKGTALFPAFKMVQETIHGLYEAANPGMINPGKVKATANVNAFLQTTPGGSYKEASFSRDRFVKLAEERKERIRREIEAQLTPTEKAAMRRLKMRGA